MSAARTAAVLAIGDELIAGRYPDRNSGVISAALDQLGIEVERFAVVGDDPERLRATMSELCARHGIVVATGGLGPTLDDVTREAAAAAAGVPLERHDAVVDELRAWFEERGRTMADDNARQGLFPAGAEVLPNLCGTAPGFRLRIGASTLFALPGPPREMRDMLERQVSPWVRATFGSGAAVAARAFHLVGISESDFSERAGAWMGRGAQPRMGVTSHTGVLSVTLRAEAPTPEAAEELLAERQEAFRERFTGLIYSEVEPDLAAAVGAQLIEREVTLSTAESCTGGLLAQRLTAVPGISAVYPGGWVTYSDQVKVRELGVPAELIELHGAVSGEVAAAMAAGAARESGARIAVALTGVAGPGGGTPAKPVGLVWCGLAVEGRVETRELRLPPVGREAVRTFAVHAALDRVRHALMRPGAPDPR